MVYLFFVSEIIPIMPCPLGSIAKTTKRLESEKQKNNLQQFANLKWKAIEFCKVWLCCPTIIQAYCKKSTMLKQLLGRALVSKNVACGLVTGGSKSMGVDQNWWLDGKRDKGLGLLAVSKFVLLLLSHQFICKEDCVSHSFHTRQGRTSPIGSQNINVFQFNGAFC